MCKCIHAIPQGAPLLTISTSFVHILDGLKSDLLASFTKPERQWRRSLLCRITLPDIYPMPSFKLQFSLGFVTSCYVIFSLSMVQAMDIFMIT